MVRFTSSGTEATLLAVRLARAVTGKNKLVRLKGHFHGWNDHMTAGYVSHFDGSPTAGVVKGVTDNVALVDADDFDALRRVFEGGDIAGAIVEPTGAQFGRLPISDDFLHEMRRLTTQTNSLLIFDEVVTGFRVARGGYQSVVGIKPDLTTLGKILAGGLPGGAVAGTRQFFDVMDDSRSRQLGRERLNHPGTYNANPLSAAAGIAALQQVKRSDACERANSTGRMLRARLNELFEAEKVPWAAYGSFSSFHIFTNPDRLKITPTSFDPSIAKEAPLGLPRDQHLLSKIRVGLLANGIDVMARVSGWISATHGEDEVAETVKAFEMLLRGLRRDGEIP
jgi:glutamate-1-semialdehyde 2,1-aminomutase